MIGMNFISFLTLLIIGVVISLVIHYLVRYKFVEGIEGFLGGIVVGWFGAWLGSPVFGHWWEPIKIDNVYIIPAILGSLTAVFFGVLLGKIADKIFGGKK